MLNGSISQKVDTIVSVLVITDKIIARSIAEERRGLPVAHGDVVQWSVETVIENPQKSDEDESASNK